MLISINLKVKLLLQFRSDKQQLEIGVYNDEQYHQSRKRSIISLQMCFLGFLIEIMDNIFIVIIESILKYKYGFSNTYLCDVVLMFVMTPFLLFLNDDDTKEIIDQEGWIQGLKFMLEIYKPQAEENTQNYRNEK